MSAESGTSADGRRITFDDDVCVAEWCFALDCTEAELHEAVHAVGDDGETVRKYLKGGKL